MKKMGLCLLTVVILASAIFIAVYTYHRFQGAIYTPRVNANPRHFVTVRGNISSRFAKRISIRWDVAYFTTSYAKVCMNTVNRLEGASFPKHFIVHYYPKRDQTGNYEVKIPLDKFLPGKCRWSAQSLSYNLLYKKQETSYGTSGLRFVNKAVKIHRLAKDVWLCSAKKNSVPICKIDPNSRMFFNKKWIASRKITDLTYMVNIK